MLARFRVETVFQITGRGVVAVGEVLEGTIEVGMRTQPLILGDGPTPLGVTGVEWVLRTGGVEAPALVFGGVHDLEAVERALPADRLLVLAGTE